MQLVYGNDGQNYATIAKSKGITDDQERRLLESYRGYGYVKNRKLYSDASKEPFSLTYVTTDILERGKRKILLVKNARMTNYTTPCSYTHMRFEEADEAAYGTDFFKLLRAGFCTDHDLNNCKNQNIDAVEIPEEAYIPDQHALSEEQLYPLVSVLLYAADSYIEQVKVIVDVEGDAYNHRALDVIASVYNCIPYHIRRIAGFSTYADPVSVIPDRVKFQLYTREAVGKMNGLVLDLSEIGEKGIPGYVPEDIREFAKLLVNLSEAERETLFLDFQETFAQEDATVRDHMVLYQNKPQWFGDADTSWNQWIAFAEFEEERDKDSTVLRVFCSLISKRVLAENLQDSYRNYVWDVLQNQNIMMFDETMKAAVHFADLIQGLDFHSEDFEAWLQEKVIMKNEQDHPDERDQYRSLMEKRDEWVKCAPDSGKFEKVKSALADFLDQSLRMLNDRMTRKKAEEKCILFNVLQGNDWNLNYWDTLKNQYQSIVYEENKSAFSEKLKEVLVNSLRNRSEFQTMSEYEDYKKFLENCRELMKASDYEDLKAVFERKSLGIMEMELAKIITWTSREDIFKTYWKLVQLEKYVSNGGEPVVCELAVKNQKFKLGIKEVRAVLDYFVSVTDEDEEAFMSVIQKNKELFEGLMDLKAFETRHFESLFKIADQMDPKLKKAVISYYLNSGVLLTEETVKKVLSKVPISVRKRFQEVDPDTILGQKLGKKNGVELKKIVIPILTLLAGAILGFVVCYLIR